MKASARKAIGAEPAKGTVHEQHAIAGPPARSSNSATARVSRVGARSPAALATARANLLDPIEAALDIAEWQAAQFGQLELPPFEPQQPLDGSVRKPHAPQLGGARRRRWRRAAHLWSRPIRRRSPRRRRPETPGRMLTLCPVHTSLPIVTRETCRGFRSSRANSLYSGTQSKERG